MKKLLSVLLAALMAFTSLAATSTAFADEAKTAKVEFSVYDGGVFTMMPEILEVKADADNAFAEAIGYNDDDSSVTVYDAIVAAHLAMFGEDFMDYAPMKYSSGMLSKSFGEESTALSYRVNGAIQSESGAYYNLDSALTDGDSVEYMFYQDTQFWGDKYTRFDKRSIDAKAGEETTLTLSVETYDESWNSVMLPAADMDIIADGETVGKTDKDGKITLKFKEAGKHYVYPTGQYSDDNDDYEIFAACCTVNVKNTLFDYINSEIEGGANYLYADKESFTVEESYILADLVRSGYKADKFAKGFADSVKQNLDANGGKLLIGENKTEDLGLYGAVITVFKALGYNPSDFNGYDLVKALNETDIEDARPHQYHYEYAIAEAEPSRAKALIDDFTAKHYSMGNGMENWGYSCDNTCKFLIAIAPYAEDYKQYVDDAKAVIKTFLLEKGAYCDPIWNSTANADSTALSMAAFASVGDVDTAFNYYRLLIENYESNNTGVFTLDGEENRYATTDGLYALTRFRDAVNKAGYDEPEHVYKFTSEKAATCSAEGNKVYTCRICGETKTDVIAKIKHTPVTDKAVAPTFKKNGKTAGSHCSVCNAILTPQKTVKKLGAAKLKKVKKGKKSFLAKWKKVKNVDGYQLQYSTNKKFKKNKKTVNIKKAKTVKKKVKKLKAKKTYYVRIRAYKTINGKKQYSKWSKVKKVKIK